MSVGSLAGAVLGGVLPFVLSNDPGAVPVAIGIVAGTLLGAAVPSVIAFVLWAAIDALLARIEESE